MNHMERIILEPDKRGGKPCIRGLRITVYDVLEYLASGMTESEILTVESGSSALALAWGSSSSPAAFA